MGRVGSWTPHARQSSEISARSLCRSLPKSWRMRWRTTRCTRTMTITTRTRSTSNWALSKGKPTCRNELFPALYRSADDLSLKSQQQFFGALPGPSRHARGCSDPLDCQHPHWSVAAAQLLALLGALGCSIYLFAMRPDRFWYAGRAARVHRKPLPGAMSAELSRSQGDDASTRNDFRQTLKQIVEQITGRCASR